MMYVNKYLKGEDGVAMQQVASSGKIIYTSIETHIINGTKYYAWYAKTANGEMFSNYRAFKSVKAALNNAWRSM
jgi:hypothetical protein